MLCNAEEENGRAFILSDTHISQSHIRSSSPSSSPSMCAAFPLFARLFCSTFFLFFAILSVCQPKKKKKKKKHVNVKSLIRAVVGKCTRFQNIWCAGHRSSFRFSLSRSPIAIWIATYAYATPHTQYRSTLFFFSRSFFSLSFLAWLRWNGLRCFLFYVRQFLSASSSALLLLLLFFCCFLLCAFSFRCWWCWFYIYIHSTICRAVCIHFVESPFLMLIVVFFSLFAIPFFLLILSLFHFFIRPFSSSYYYYLLEFKRIRVRMCDGRDDHRFFNIMFFFHLSPASLRSFPDLDLICFFSFLQIIIQNVFYTHSHTK